MQDNKLSVFFANKNKCDTAYMQLGCDENHKHPWLRSSADNKEISIIIYNWTLAESLIGNTLIADSLEQRSVGFLYLDIGNWALG